MATPFLRERAEQVAQEVVKKLEPYCSRIEIAGSIRRKKHWVHDIDIVCIPEDSWNLYHTVIGLCRPLTPGASGQKLMRFKLPNAGIEVDLYFASEMTWATLLLIRTGSAQNNIRLAKRAKDLGWHLHADGTGLFAENGHRIAGDTEASIYKALGLTYQSPEERG